MGVEAGLTLDQFWRLTPYGLHIILAAYGKRIRLRYELAAWHASCIMNMWSKKRIRPKDLLKTPGHESIDVSLFDSAEELNQYLEAKKKKSGDDE
jgi:hypothetical protein